MTTKVFINLPVNDLQKSKDFYTKLGWTLNPDFTDDNAAAVTISDTIHLMILTHEHWAQFTDKPIADTATTSAVINAISVETPEDVDALANRAVAAGATEGQRQDHGFMRSRSFATPTVTPGNSCGWTPSPKTATGTPSKPNTAIRTPPRNTRPGGCFTHRRGEASSRTQGGRQALRPPLT
jgi:predicted lactoylglutathione lyase